ncbi:alpha/beta fold hydrolase, partial [Gordonia otitidis]
EVLDSSPDRFVLVGLSLGAIVGFEILRIAPERVVGFCAISTNPRNPTAQQLTAWRDMAAATRAGHFRHVVSDILAPKMFADPESLQSNRARFEAMARRVGPEVFRNQLAAQSTRTDARTRLRDVGCPALVLSAQFDALCPRAFHT